MTAYIIRRVWQMIPTLLGVVLLVFFLFNWVGGDPAYVLAGKISNQEQIDNIRRQLGVDQPYWVQLWIFIKQVLTTDFGASWSTNEMVSHILATRLGPSFTVLVPLLILDTLISLALALAVAYVRGTLTDRLVMILCTVGLSISILVYIIVFQYFFAYKLGWFPVQGWGDSFGENLFRFASLPIVSTSRIGLLSIAPYRAARPSTPDTTLRHVFAVAAPTSALIAPITLSSNGVVTSPRRTSPSAGKTWLSSWRRYVSTVPGDLLPSRTFSSSLENHSSAATENRSIAARPDPLLARRRFLSLSTSLDSASEIVRPVASIWRVRPSKSR